MSFKEEIKNQVAELLLEKISPFIGDTQLEEVIQTATELFDEFLSSDAVVSVQRALAKSYFCAYRELTNVGFTDDQAMEVLCASIGKMSVPNKTR